MDKDVPKVKLQFPEDLTTEEVIKSLEATIETLRKSEREPDLVERFSKENPAASHLVSFIDESFDIMAESLVKEISKVFGSK